MELAPASTCVLCDDEKNRTHAQLNNPSLSASSSGSIQPLSIECLESHQSQANLLYGSLEPLDPSQIRILELQPGGDRQPLVGRLFNADILFHGGVLESGTRRRHSYVAISYFWGEDQSPRYHLECNGIDLPIPREAHRALHRARDPQTPLCVWIDTLCINQLDDVDKASQVATMRYTFQNASMVLVYLGEFDMTERYAGEKRTPAGELLFHVLEKYQFCHGSKRRDSHFICDHHAALLEVGLRGLSQLKWFDRVWIKQEVWAARAIKVMYGRAVLRLRNLRLLDECMGLGLPGSSQSQRDALFVWVRVIKTKLDRLGGGTPMRYAHVERNDAPNPLLEDEDDFGEDIINVLRRSTGAQCSRMHDHIYGLMGMAAIDIEPTNWGPSGSNCFPVSYEEHPAVTFMRLATYLIRRDECMNILLLDSAFPRPDGAGEVEGQTLPSWVPDWRFAVGHVESYVPEDECWEYYWPVPSQNALEPHVLHAKCIILGEVSSWHVDKKANSAVVTMEWTHQLVEQNADRLVYAPWTTKSDDCLAILAGVYGPVLIRPTEFSVKTYTYVGPVHTREKTNFRLYQDFYYCCRTLGYFDTEDPTKGYSLIALV